MLPGRIRRRTLTQVNYLNNILYRNFTCNIRDTRGLRATLGSGRNSVRDSGCLPHQFSWAVVELLYGAPMLQTSLMVVTGASKCSSIGSNVSYASQLVNADLPTVYGQLPTLCRLMACRNTNVRPSSQGETGMYWTASTRNGQVGEGSETYSWDFICGEEKQRG
jgi:hypothetical protein